MAKPRTFVTITDSFNRADSTTTLGNADTGQAWTNVTGVLGISSNQAYRVTAVSNEAVALLETGITDMIVKGTPVSGVTNRIVGLIGRATDGNNFYLVLTDGSSVGQLYKKVAGTFIQLGSNFALITGVMELRCQGSTVSVYNDGVLVASETDTALTTGTQAGFRISGTSGTPRLDDFSVEQG
jgi:hypothetical protein